MEYKHHERGYTLFITVLTILLFGILSATLLTFTVSGAFKSETREDATQATELAEKGLNYITQEITTTMEKKISEHVDGVTEEIYEQYLDETLDQFICTEETEFVESTTGKYRACIKDKGERTLPRDVVFESDGKAEDQEKKILSTLRFGADFLPDHRQYTVNSFITKECAEDENKCLPGEGNVYLHGGVAIQGDIHARRNLITSNRSHEKYVGHHWIHSYYPSAEPKPNGDIPTVLVGNDIYTLYWDDISGTKIRDFDYSEHVSRLNFSTDSPYEKKELVDETVFVGSYVAKQCHRTDHPDRKDIDVNQVETKYKYDRNDPGVKIIETNLFGEDGVDRVIRNAHYPQDKVFPKWYSNFEGNFIVNGHSTFKQFSTNGNLKLGAIRQGNVIEFKEGAYIDGDVTVYSNTHIKGPIYVNGDLHIKGRNITLDNVFYVNGQVHMKHASGDETIDSNIKGEFIIYSNGKIVIERINRFNDHPMTLKGYLFSNESVEMDGNESNIHLKGGISAPRIVLNGIRGRSYAGANLFEQSDPQIVEARAYEGYKEQAKRKSRLKITFDTSIFDKYSDLILHDRVTTVAPPQVIDREEIYVNP